MPSYCEEQYIHSLEKKIEEQESMIDWLASRLQTRCDNPGRHACDVCPMGECHNHNWRKAAQEAVKKNG